MKQILICIAFLGFIGSSTAQKIKWYSFTEGIEKAKKEDKKVFIDVYTDWCGYCVKMDKTTFSNSEVAKEMNKHFIAIKFNAETKDTINFKDYQFVGLKQGNGRTTNTLAYALVGERLSFPSFVFLSNKDFNKIDVVKGYIQKDHFINILEYIGTDSFKTTKFKDFIEAKQKKE
ncbi:MAG: thioredoxin family protein [Bacteroidales bacterium]